jgi:proteasome-associated ATPase
MAKGRDDDLLQTLLSKADELKQEEEKALLERLLATSSHVAPHLCMVYFEKHRGSQTAIDRTTQELRELKTVVEKLSALPWYPCDFLRYSAALQKAIGSGAGRRLVVAVSPDIESAVIRLRAGAEVYLNRDMNCIIALGESPARTRAIGVFDRYNHGRGILKGVADQEIVVDLASELDNGTELQAGDHVIFDVETRIAYEKVERSHGQEYFIEETPAISFEAIGGIDDIIEEIVDELTLTMFHPEVARRYQLRTAKGILLAGPPGCGKTMLAKAIARYMAHLASDGRTNGACKFMNIKPGSQRSMWYGQTEANVREIFRVAREAAQHDDVPIIIFFDVVDNLGVRSGSVIDAIDSRVLTAFLTEIDGLEEAGNIFLIGATNRVDLLDEALMRPGRFGDKVFHLHRPNREAAEDIFRKYLTPDLPYAVNGTAMSGAEMVEELIETALVHLYSPKGEGNHIATLTLRDGKKQPVYAPEVMSGALIANVVREAKRQSCVREARGGEAGMAPEDLLEAIDQELETLVTRLKKVRQIHTILSELPDDLDVIRVEGYTRQQRPRGYAYLRRHA